MSQPRRSIPAHHTGAIRSLALRTDGTIIGWGGNDYGEINTPAGNNFTAVAAGGSASLALRNDGSIVAWGDNTFGQTNAPAGDDFIAVVGGINRCLALREDGSIAVWGYGAYGLNIPPTGGSYTAIAVGGLHSLALETRCTYNDLLVTGTGNKATLKRNITVSGNATITSAGSATFSGGARLSAGTLDGSGSLRISDGGGAAALTVGSASNGTFSGTIGDASTPGLSERLEPARKHWSGQPLDRRDVCGRGRVGDVQLV
ncbi:MAG: hypothetical protein FJ388_04010 [Verrucomicrobia bacterium]|nr:hypothetical protein [Verrucomicrobiota bacterium]